VKGVILGRFISGSLESIPPPPNPHVELLLYPLKAGVFLAIISQHTSINLFLFYSFVGYGVYLVRFFAGVTLQKMSF